MFNPRLIDPSKDADIYANACPTLGTLMLAHYSTPEEHNHVIYAKDCAYFADNSEASMHVRLAFAGEFDPFTTWEKFYRLPKLWVLVIRLVEGVHEITPRWRGERYWKEPLNDDAIVLLLIEFAKRGGMRLSEWYGYVCDQRNEDREEREKSN